MNITIDTSCLVSFFLVDANYNKTRKVLEKVMKGEIRGIISVLSLAELLGVMKRNTDENIAKEVKYKIEEWIEKGLLLVVPFEVSDAYEAGHIAIKTGVKGADAIIVQATKSNDAKLFTFDNEIKKKAKDEIDFYEVE